MATTESAKKVCIVCGADVAGKPRVKDAAGRYMCAGECQEKAAAAAAAKAKARAAAPVKRSPSAGIPPVAVKVSAPPAGKREGSLLGDLISSSPMVNAVACTACGNPMPGGAVVCTRCGYNTQTGKNLKTAVIREKEKKDPKIKAQKYSNRYAVGEAGPPLWKMVLIETGFLFVVGLLPFAGDGGSLATVGIYFIALVLACVGGTWAAFKNDQVLWGICGICMMMPLIFVLGVFGLLINFIGFVGFLVYNLFFNEDKYSRALFLSFAMCVVINVTIIVIAAFMIGMAFAVGGKSIGGPVGGP